MPFADITYLMHRGGGSLADLFGQIDDAAFESRFRSATVLWLLFPSYSEVFTSTQNSCFAHPSFTRQSC